MTQEDKELLMKDLCARLLYRVKIRIQSKPRILFGVQHEGVQQELVIVRGKDEDGYNWQEYDIEEWNVKPYLRPMSSMTEKEDIEYTAIGRNWPGDIVRRIDWLNSHHFDYRCLIEKGLALEAPEGMYNKNKDKNVLA